MTRLQEKLLGLLCEIDEICRKHGVAYCLFAGTGLGADRHGGFIPWDDDADIIMTLDNYEKFLSVFEKEAKENRALNCLEKDAEGYPFTYARYVDTGTTAIQRHTAFGGCDPGIKVDIFVVVPTHSKLEKAEKHRLEILAFSEAINPYAIMHHHRPEGFAKAFASERKILNRLGRKKYIIKRMEKLKHYIKGTADRYVLLSGMMSNSYIFDADIFDNIEYVKFENVELPISKENVKFTKQLYGEGWISKPKNVEIPRHTFLLDMDMPYENYIEKLWNKLDFKSTEQIASKRRDNHLEERDGYKDVLINNQRLRNLVVGIGINNGFYKLTSEEKNMQALTYEFFGEYYDVQLKSINKDYNLFIDVPEDVFYAAMNAAILMDRYYVAAEIIKIGIRAGKLSDKNQQIQSLTQKISICRELTEKLYVYKKLDEVKNVLCMIDDDELSHSLTVMIASLWVKVAEAKSNNEFMSICEQTDEVLDRYPEIGEILIIKGHCLEQMGEINEAAEVFKKASENVTNGFIYQELANKGFSTYEN